MGRPFAPLALLGGYLLAAGAALGLRRAIRGPFRDPEVESRGDSVVLPMGARLFFVWALQPLWWLVKRSGVPATAITVLGAMLAFAAGLAVAQGALALGGWLYLASGVGDFLDGRMARSQRTASRSGAAIDSVLDRYSDAAILLGLAWYFRTSWALALVLAALVGALLVSYVRARGEGLGVSVTVGVMQRPERVALIGAALALGPAIEAAVAMVSADAVVIAVVGIVALMSHVTSLHRLFHLLGRLQERPYDGRRLLPAAISAALATCVDFALVVILVSRGGLSPALATALGCGVGGVTNFLLNRWWTFASRDKAMPQALRYALVSAASAALNSGGVALVIAFPAVDYRIGWLLVRALLFVCWTFPLQRGYVYGVAEPGQAAPRDKTAVLVDRRIFPLRDPRRAD